MKEFKEDNEGILDYEEEEKFIKSKNSYQKNELSNKNSKHRWDELHDLNEVKKQARKILKDNIITKNQKELSKCTFQPQLLEKSLEMTNKKGISFLERNKNWQEIKEKKIRLKNEHQKKRKLYYCTFSPKKLSTSNLLNKKKKMNLKSNASTEQFVERQEYSRKVKKKKKNYFKYIKEKNKSLPKRKKEGVYMNKFIKQKINTLFKLDSLENQIFSKCCYKLHNQIQGIKIQL